MIMCKSRCIPYSLLAFSASVFAAQPPSAGNQMQQIPPNLIQQKALPKVEIEQGNTAVAPGTDDLKIIVQSLKISGSQAYTQEQLLAVIGFLPGSALTLADLRGMAAKIADHYHRNGYFVAQAYLPPQDIKDGAVTIKVIDGQYGKVTLHNQTNLSDDLANQILSGLNNGDYVTSAPLENRLLLLSDIPGVVIKSTLVPGASVGASDLIVDVLPGQRVTGSVNVDNAGNRYTGANRLGASFNLNDPAGRGDMFTLRALASGSGLHYARVAYQIQHNKVKAGFAYSSLGYALGRDFASLQADGNANISSIYASYPLIRSRNNNLYVQIAHDAKTFQDRLGTASTVTDKSASVWMTSLNGNFRDKFYGAGLSSYSVTFSSGNIEIQTPMAQISDAATAQSNGHFNKLGFSAMRLQHMTDSISFYALINGQIASKNLDVSEKMELGGMYAVRAYPEGEGFADQGAVVNLEVRKELPKYFERWPGQMQLIGFVDTGTVKVNKNIWSAGQNTRTLSGTGAGLNWSVADDFVVKAYYAFKLGGEVTASEPDSSGRFWMQAMKYF
jgi:hemolysin activation/secretion protein